MSQPRFVVQFKLERKPNRDRPERTIERARILVGSRPLADVYVADRLVPQEAFELSFDGRRVEIAVKGSLAGVFVDGRPVEGAGPVRPGAAIQCGACLFEVSVDEAEQVCRVVVGERYLTAAVGALGKKAATPFALEESGPQEHRWGKSPVLRTANWAAVGVGLVLLAALAFSHDTALVDRGALSLAHQTATHEGKPLDCEGCHAAFASDYGPRCATCHEGFDSPAHHPYARAGDVSCAECHPEHRGAEASLLPPAGAAAGAWPRACAECHAGEDRAAKTQQALARADLAAKTRDRAGEPVSRRLLVDGFSHADHRVAKPPRASLAASAVAPRGDVPIPCAKCHAAAEGLVDAEGFVPDFASVPYEKCLECHAEWRVDVHGRDQGGVHCFQCHASTDDVAKIARAIRTVDVAPASGVYELVPRRHDQAKDDCRACHVTAKSGAFRAATETLAFRHDHHLRTVTPPEHGELALAATCVPCHEDVAESASLGGLGESLPVAKLDGCVTCHTDGAPKPKPAPGGPPRRAVVDMFHAVHTVEPGTRGALRALSGRESLARGCLACHVPSAGTERMTLRAGVADCSACHAGHESLGGGRCAVCHVDREAKANRDARGNLVYRANDPGIFAAEKAVTKATAPVARFDHFSPGHAADATSGACAKCHDAAAVDGAQRVRDVPWPGATEPACLACHVAERFHR